MLVVRWMVLTCMCVFLRSRRPPGSTRTDPRFADTAHCRSVPQAFAQLAGAAKLAVEDAAASRSFQRLAILPIVLLAVFGFIWMRERGKSRAMLAGETA